jgi:hypothetical protein
MRRGCANAYLTICANTDGLGAVCFNDQILIITSAKEVDASGGTAITTAVPSVRVADWSWFALLALWTRNALRTLRPRLARVTFVAL